jgi:hypothetical protein
MATPKAPAIRRQLPLRRKVKPIWELAEEIMRDVPEEELRKLPADGARNLEHYLHGAPRKP